jgi:hypothetical protein
MNGGGPHCEELSLAKIDAFEPEEMWSSLKRR